MRYSCLLLLVIGLGVPAIAQNRMPAIPPDKLTEEQKKAKAACDAAEANTKKIYGSSYPRPIPTECTGSGWDTVLRSPELMLTINAMREYVEYHPALPPKIRELVIVITARQWNANFMYDRHYEVAIKTGLSAGILKAIAEGQRPTGMSEDEATTYDFLDELHRNQSISDTTYARTLAKFGEQGIIDLTGVYGWYCLWVMMHQVTSKPAVGPEGPQPTLTIFHR
jgi:4-carboxymuconolactone decarboxylase